MSMYTKSLRIKVRAYQASLMAVSGLAICMVAGSAWAAEPKWTLAPESFFKDSAPAPSAMVDAADLNGDGRIDLVFANYGGDTAPGETPKQAQQAFFSKGQGLMDVSEQIFKGETYAARAVKLRDVEGDGDVDIFLGTTWESRSQLLINDGSGGFTNETKERLPPESASVGDVEFGDLDLDGDLDIVLSDWGPGNAAANSGGVTMIWLQEGTPVAFGSPGTGKFVNETEKRMPPVKVRWSHDLELADVDNDSDLDIIVSSYADTDLSYFLFKNDGPGEFSHGVQAPVQNGKYGLGTGVFDLDDDGWVDLVTLHDDGFSGRNRLLLGSSGGFTPADWDNSLSKDHGVAFYDWDSDGKVDFLLGASQFLKSEYPDRVISNALVEDSTAFSHGSPGTSALVLADFNKDKRLDVAMAQRGNAVTKLLFLATEEVVPIDTRPPTLTNIDELRSVDGGDALQYPGTARLRLRCHDGKSPLMLHDFDGETGRPHIEYWLAEPADEAQMPDGMSSPGVWYGEYLWQVELELPDTAKLFYKVCARDAADNPPSCSKVVNADIERGGIDTDGDSSTSTGTGTSTSTTGAETAGSTGSGAGFVPVVDYFECECRASAGRSVVGDLASMLLLLAARPRRRRRR